MMRSKSSSFSGEIPPSVEVRKLVFVGDAGVGKTTLLSSYRKGEFHDNEKEPVPVLEGFTRPVTVQDKEHICLLWDTIGSTDFERLRPLSYPKTDCFVICFAINDRTSFENLKTIWIPEIQLHSPDVPYIFVATKTDVKKLVEPASTTISKSEDLTPAPPPTILTIDEIMAFITSTDGLDYVECSARDLVSILNILKSSVNAILTYQEKQKAIEEANNSKSFCVIC